MTGSRPPQSDIPQGVHEVADHYSRATGIPCMILDVIHASMDDRQCSVCTLVNNADPKTAERCFQTHLHNAMLSERFGGSYIYFCLFSMLYWVSPVYMNGRMEFAIIAGPVMVLDDAEALEDPLVTSDEIRIKVERELKQLPHLEISRVHNLSEVLRMCAGWASGYAEHRMVENRQIMQMQSRLSEYIQEIKEGGDTAIDRLRSYPIEKEERLQEAIRWGDRQTAQEVMNELLGMIFFVSGNTIDRIRFRVIELVSLFSRAAVQGGAPEDEILEMSYRCQREVGYYNSLEGMALWLSKILHQFTDLVFASKDTEYGTMIAQAIRYIRKHFTEHITLEDVSAAVSLSPNYFSRIFNAKMNISFTSYVNRLRVEEAQRLLLNTRLSLVEIAGAVGFEDQSYFTKVFKRIASLSPGQYRKRAGRFPTDNQEIHENGKEFSGK